MIFKYLIILFLYYIKLSNESSVQESNIIDNNHLSIANQSKHLVSIRMKIIDEMEYGQGFVCTGSLISYRIVTTAAFCVFGFSTNTDFIYIVGGNLKLNEKNMNTFISDVKHILIHPDYVLDHFDNDIALVQLITDVPYNHPTLKPINYRDPIFSIGKQCKFYGWALPQPGQTLFNDLLEFNVIIHDSKICNSISVNFTENIICTSSCINMICNWQCNGYFGGSLVCDDLLIGIMSMADLECKHAVHSNFNYYYKWISENNSNIITSNVLFCFVINLILVFINYW